MPAQFMNKRKLLALISLILLVSFCLFFMAGCQVRQDTAMPSPTLTLTPTNTLVPPTHYPAEGTQQPEEEQVIATPTLAPTATPSPLDFVVDDIVRRASIDDLTILGMSGENLVNTLISAMIVLLGVLMGNLVLAGALWLVQRTATNLDDRLLKAVSKQLKWLIPLILI